MDDLIENRTKIAVTVLLKLVIPLYTIPRLWIFIGNYKSGSTEGSYQIIYLAS